MKDENDILRSAISGLFDIQAEPEKVIVTAPAPLCDAFYRFLSDRHPESRTIMFRPPLELGHEIHFLNSSSEQVIQWVNRFSRESDSNTVHDCYRAIYP